MKAENNIYNYKGKTASDFLIRISVESNGSWTGTLEHVQTGKVISVIDFLEITLLIQRKLEELDFPQAATKIRSWAENNGSCYIQNISTREDFIKGRENKMQNQHNHKSLPGKGTTFFIRIHYRQNASWQGSIQWIERNSTVFFRSHLEMIMLMQEALDKNASSDSEIEIKSWENNKGFYK